MADDSTLGIRVEGDTDPFRRDFDDAVTDAEGRSRDLGRVFDGVAQHISELGGEIPLKTDAAQEALKRAEEAARRAAAQARAFGEEARAGGTGAGEAAGKAAAAIAKLEAEVAKLKAAGRNVEALEAELKALQAQTVAIPTSMQAAEEAVARFGAKAAGSGKGAAVALGAATAATDQLEAEIDQLAAKGVKVDAFRAKLDAMRVSIEANTLKAGKMRGAMADASDALKVATARGGELSGQMGSLDGVLRLLGAGSLAETAERALALQGAFLITVATAKQFYDILEKLTKYAGNAWAEDLIRQQEAADAASGATARYAANLRNVLAQQGYDVAADSVQGLMEKEREFQDRLRARGPAVDKLLAQIRGDLTALADDTAVTLGALEELAKVKGGDPFESAKASGAAYAELLRMIESRSQATGSASNDLTAGLKSVSEGLLAIGSPATARAVGDLEAVAQALANTALEAAGVRTTAAEIAAFAKASVDAAEPVKNLALRVSDLNDPAKAKRAAAAVTELVQKYKDAGDEVPPVLQKWDTYLQRLVGTHVTLASRAKEMLEAVGVQTPDAIADTVRALEDYSREIELAGGHTTASAKLMLDGIEGVRTAMDKLPESARADVQGLLDRLQEYEQGLRQTADAAAATFGVTTPAAISRSIEALQGLIATWGGVSGTTQEQAARIAAEAQKIRESIATLPEAERDAAAAQAQILEGITVTYGKVAGSRQKFAIDILEAERKAAEEEARLIEERRQRLESLADAIGSTFSQLRQSLEKPAQGGEDIAALTEQIQALEKANIDAGLSLEELDKLGELRGQLAGAQQAAAGWGQEAKKTTLGAQEVDAALSGLFDTLAQDGGRAFREIGEIQRDEIASMLDRLQETASRSGVSGDEINAVFGRIGEIVQEAGGSVGDLTNDIARSQESTLDLGRELERLSPKLDAAGEGMGKIGEEAKTTAERQEEAAKKTEEFAERAERAAASVVKSAGDMNEQFSTIADTIGRCVELLEAMDRLASGITIDEAA